MRNGLFLAVLLASAFNLACGDDTVTTPTTPTTPASPTTRSFSSKLTVKGAVSRTFTATQAGTVSATLTSAGSASTRVGLGIGVPYGGIATCTLNSMVTTTAGASPQISATVDAGQYCVAVFDVGALTDDINFDLTIVFP